MAVLLTGATGYLGSYIAAGLLRGGERVLALVRARGKREGGLRLWRAWQLHFPFPEFESRLAEQVEILPGNLESPGLGLPPALRRHVVESADSVIHCAASLNRLSERSAVNVNFRGTLAMIRLARELGEHGALRRFTHVSTVAVAGERSHEAVMEDTAVDWRRRDHDPYARTKKMAEHLVRELLGELPYTIVRPSIVLGDSRRPETTQFDMVSAFSILAGSPILPFRPGDRLDVVPVDWVTRAILSLHADERPAHAEYHLSSGAVSPTFREVAETVAAALERPAPLFVPLLERPMAGVCAALSRVGPRAVRRNAALLGVFLPYLTWDTVFDNSRIVKHLGESPAPLPEWGVPLLQWARRHRFTYPYEPWPGERAQDPSPPARRPEGRLVS